MKVSQGRSFFLTLICIFLLIGTNCKKNDPLSKERHTPNPAISTALFIENSEFDFGNMSQGKISTANFVYRNISKESQKIQRVTSDTVGLNADISVDFLQPGEEGILSITLDSTMLSGPVIGHISMTTNREESPQPILRISAIVDSLVMFQSHSIFVGKIKKDASFSGRAMVKGKLVEEGRLRDFVIETSSPAIEAKIQSETSDTDSLWLEFVIHPELKAGTFNEAITLLSENPHAFAKLSLLGQKLGIITFTPDRMEFFTVNGKKPKSRSIVFECEKPFKIIKLEDLSGALKLSIKTLEKGKKYRLTAKLKQTPKEGLLSVVKVHTDLEEHPLIHIPVIGGR